MTEAAYIPNREEIEKRSEFERQMREYCWPDEVLVSIMVYDMPQIETCRSLIRRHGHQMALMKILHMID